MRHIQRLCLLMLAAACQSEQQPGELTEEEAKIATEVGFELTAARRIRSYGEELRRLTGLDEDWNEVSADGLVLITEETEGLNILRRLRAELDPARYSVYLYDRGYGYGPDAVAVLATPDPYAYLRIVRINGINYDIEHADVIERLRVWDERYGLNLVGAGMDWLQAEFSDPPSDWDRFAAEVYEFCPDVVDQGAGSVEALADELRQMNGVYLWWD